MHRSLLLVLNIVAAVAAVAWIGFYWMLALGTAFGSASGQSYLNKPLVGYIVWSVPVVTAICILLSRMHPKTAVLFAAAPFVWTVVALVVTISVAISYGQANARNVQSTNAAQAAGVASTLSAFSRDYVCTDGNDELLGATKTFLTHDSDLNAIVEVTTFSYRPGRPGVGVIGTISDTTLETLYPLDDIQSEYGSCRDKNGKTLAENYTLKYVPGRSPTDFDIYKYFLKE